MAVIRDCTRVIIIHCAPPYDASFQSGPIKPFLLPLIHNTLPLHKLVVDNDINYQDVDFFLRWTSPSHVVLGAGNGNPRDIHDVRREFYYIERVRPEWTRSLESINFVGIVPDALHVLGRPTETREGSSDRLVWKFANELRPVVHLERGVSSTIFGDGVETYMRLLAGGHEGRTRRWIEGWKARFVVLAEGDGGWCTRAAQVGRG